MSTHDDVDLERALAGATVCHVQPGDLRSADSPRLEGESSEHVDNLLTQADELPPLIVHRQSMRVIDGMHRLEVALRRGEEYVPVRFFDGPDHDCFPLAVRLNAVHGLPLSLGDKVAAAARIVRTHPAWSDRKVAALVGVSPKTVAARRSSEECPQLNGRIGQDGRMRSSDTASRRRVAADYLSRHPDASLRTLGREAGLSVGTARDVRLRVAAGQDPVPSRVTGKPRCQPEPERTVTALAGTAASSVPADESIEDVVDCLRRDPTIRMSECGRVLIRILGASCALTAQPALLVTAVPEHHAESVAGAARRMSTVWSRFADQLERSE